MSETTRILQKKILKILGLLLLIRLGLYIPIPNIDLDILSQTQATNSFLGLARNLTGSTFLAVGSLGILPYINASIVIQLLTPIIPALERLQKEEGELGRQQINQYTRYLTLGWAIILSCAIAFIIVKPIVFNWSIILALKIILSLTTGSMLSMWFAELITNESLGNGSSMIIFINILGSIPTKFGDFEKNVTSSPNTTIFFQLFLVYAVYLFILLIIVLVQDAYKRVNIVSAKQINSDGTNSQKKNNYIPIKLNQGGIMPLVFSTTIVTFLFYPLQILLSSMTFFASSQITTILSFLSVGLNLVLVVFFSSFYALLVLKPKDLSENLTKMAYSLPGLKQGKQTVQFLEQIISRLAFMGGLFLAFLTFFPVVLGNFFQFNVFSNLTSLIILIGVVTDVSSQIRGYLVSQNYESLKKT
jgi:preprotein translocase subunit SecY